MKAKFINSTTITGYLYSHKLEKKVSGPKSKTPGTPFISGTISIATDESITNVVDIHYTYVTQTTANGKADSRWNDLSKIIDGVYKNVMEAGKENATMLSVNSAIGLNEFYSDRSGKEELVCAKRNEGGFISVVTTLPENELQRATFAADCVVTNVRRMEANEDRGTPEKVVIKGCIFDFRKTLLPVEFSVLNPDAMNYFEGLEVSDSNPAFFSNMRGYQVSQVTVRKIEETSPWNTVSIKEVPSTHKDYVVEMCTPDMWDDESTITATEMQELIAQREIHKAEIKKRNDEYKAQAKTASAAPASSSTPAAGTYQF